MKQPSSREKNTNAISLLKSDHRMVEDMFKQIEATGDDAELAELVVALQTALSVHTRIEEEVFYPALRASVAGAGDLLDEAAIEHGSAKHFLIDLSTSSNDHRFYRARLKVLKEHVNHHVREEEEKLMPMARNLLAFPCLPRGAQTTLENPHADQQVPRRKQARKRKVIHHEEGCQRRAQQRCQVRRRQHP